MRAEKSTSEQSSQQRIFPHSFLPRQATQPRTRTTLPLTTPALTWLQALLFCCAQMFMWNDAFMWFPHVRCRLAQEGKNSICELIEWVSEWVSVSTPRASGRQLPIVGERLLVCGCLVQKTVLVFVFIYFCFGFALEAPHAGKTKQTLPKFEV